jgi:nucleolar protein TMA23
LAGDLRYIDSCPSPSHTKMNAHALLTAQGWRGHGHSLHKSDDKIGLAKPLLLSRKDNTKGLGVAQHFNTDQWWLSAFDEQLKGLEMTETGVKQTVKSGKLDTIQKGAAGRWSVYQSFVKGGFLDGTLSLLEKESTTSGAESTEESSESKDDADNDATTVPDKGKKETKEERRARKEAKRKRKEERAKEKAARRERKKAKRNGVTIPKGDELRDEKRRRREKKEEKRRNREKESKKQKS